MLVQKYLLVSVFNNVFPATAHLNNTTTGLMIHPETLDFLQQLAENNNKPWFDAHKNQYQKVKTNYLEAATRLLYEMQRVDDSLSLLEPKDCLFRINRDIRFSHDKSPYKTHLGIVLTTGGKKSGLAAYYLHIQPGHAFIGGGIWMPENTTLAKIRKEIRWFNDDLSQILQNPDFTSVYGNLDADTGTVLTRPPRGYSDTDPGIEWIKLKSFTATAAITDEVLCSGEAQQVIVHAWKCLQPFIHFLNRGILADMEDTF